MPQINSRSMRARNKWVEPLEELLFLFSCSPVRASTLAASSKAHNFRFPALGSLLSLTSTHLSGHLKAGILKLITRTHKDDG
ncbi:uncharacterized protein Dyak_GE28828 [Drosophila yakuba]|uniref:Uncharacterized protein n=1 Tax=Drosophila yakuba TaxID=7245 RepID=A0A0R1DX40_DROYA|nr:uncharacterized protein Dyak_GE28828 [Drosophila yakuba]